MTETQGQIQAMSVESGQVVSQSGPNVEDSIRKQMCYIICDNKQLICTLWLHFMTIATLALSIYFNLLSDVTWDFSGVTHFDIIYYDCGWQELRIEYFYSSGVELEATYKYSGHLCDNDAYNIWTHKFCRIMNEIGTVWFIFNGIAAFFTFLNIILVFKQMQNIKWNIAYIITNFLCILFICIGCGYWWENEMCSSMETHIATNYVIRSTIGMYVL